MRVSKNILILLIKSLNASDEKQTLQSFEMFFLKIILFSVIENMEKHCPKSLEEITLNCKILIYTKCPLPFIRQVTVVQSVGPAVQR